MEWTQVGALMFTIASAVAVATWAINNKITASNTDVASKLAALTTKVEVRNQACVDCSSRIDNVIVPQLQDQEKRLRVVEFGSALSELLQAVDKVHKGQNV